MADPYQTVFSTVSDPAERAKAVVPSDTVDLAETPKSIYVGFGGDIAMIGDNEAPGAAPVTFPNVQPGSTVPYRPRRIMATGTTASGIVALY